MTKIDMLRNALVSGEKLTSAQITARYGLQNPRAAVHALRHTHGVAVYNNRTMNSKGQVKFKYRAGTPSRKVIAAGYRAIAMGL